MAIGGKRTNRGYWLTANRPQCPFLREMGNVMVYVEIVLQLRTVGGFKFLHHTPPGGGIYPLHSSACLLRIFFVLFFLGLFNSVVLVMCCCHVVLFLGCMRLFGRISPIVCTFYRPSRFRAICGPLKQAVPFFLILRKIKY